MVLHYSHEQIVWQEVPGETSLAYTISGCPVGCKGCHSVDTWPKGSGQALTQDYLLARLMLYQDLISCVLFLGGEWQPHALLPLLRLAKEKGLKTCLYTGLDTVSGELQAELDYLKTGPWIAALGGLDSPNTNQRFVHLASGACLNQHFWRAP
ncbi:anaerobic ribonucleoside-triphosphate reductase activating protein [Oceanisphaera avium]|uniref:Anaerobic ribonucleoside-triphosphate reductase activating protein n=1 Tax=Oceanisphaera avium TaxID=1903694 RepID=A0A1Y0CVQ5_9GAMM|nr:anaerobic ribonucleoside-triphosphate reductase activating protein [Oceanisphaera avium]ART79298.1 anaerobic ribonucleoside-triphosphate reductase activating protein [Oceanisphaera avium]